MRLGIDTGGTFTDSVDWDGKTLRLGKLPSTPANPAQAIAATLDLFARGRAAEVAHGTTVATNALLERAGARVAFVTNRGFEDLLFLGRQERPDIYSLHPSRSQPLVSENLCFGVSCRQGPHGEAWGSSLQQPELDSLAQDLQNSDAQAIAICLLHAWRDPSQEQALARALAFLQLPISLSSDVLPRFREFERASATVINAYLQPRVQSYLQQLDRLQEKPLQVMLSSGGLLPSHDAAKKPAHLLLSGPAAGLLGAKWLGERLQAGAMLTLDMGGTSTDVAVIDGPLSMSSEHKIGEMRIALPMVDLHTIGAGGGSIAHLDAGGFLKVGPKSAGALPGPACYGHSMLPTVTDANLVLGRLPEDLLLGGAVRLDRERSRQAILPLAMKAGLSVEELALGILRVVDANMEHALRVVTVQRGIDPRPLTLLAFGGAGALHAAALAEAMGIKRILAPALAGTLSAVGLAVAEQVHFATASLLLPWNANTYQEALAWFGRQEGMFGQGQSLREAQVRYAGQSFELTVPFGPDLEERFHAAHQAQFGVTHDLPLELVHVSLRMVRGEIFAQLPPVDFPPATQVPGKAQIYLQGLWTEVPRLQQWALPEGFTCEGPALLTSQHFTGYVPPMWRIRADKGHNVWLEK